MARLRVSAYLAALGLPAERRRDMAREVMSRVADRSGQPAGSGALVALALRELHALLGDDGSATETATVRLSAHGRSQLWFSARSGQPAGTYLARPFIRRAHMVPEQPRTGGFRVLWQLIRRYAA